MKTSEGFETATSGTSNPFENLANYTKYYSNLVNVSGNFWYDPINGNIYRASLTTDGDIIGATIIDRYQQKVNIDFSETAEEPDKPEKIIKKNTVDKIIKNWSELDTAKKVQINYIAVGEKTYIVALDISDTQACKITKMLYYENKTLKKKFNLTSSNEFALISKESYLVTSVGSDSSDFTHVKEPLYDNKSKTVYQIMKHIKYDKKNGNLILNLVSSETTAATTAVAATTKPTTSGFRNREGFSDATTTNAINVYKRKMSTAGFVTTPPKPQNPYKMKLIILQMLN